MSLTLDIANETIVVATMDVYRKYWLPLAVEFDLGLIGKFDYLQVDTSNVEELIAQLQVLDAKFTERYEESLACCLSKRVRRMMDALMLAKVEPKFIATIG